jgi:hypothetical protein
MAVTGSAELDDSNAAEQVAQLVVATIETLGVYRPFVFTDELFGSNVKSYSRLGALTAGTLTEGTDGVATAMTDSQVSATLGTVGIGIDLTDEERVAYSPGQISERAIRAAGAAYAKLIDNRLLAKLVNLTDSVGTTAQALTEDVWLSGIYESDANDINGRQLAFFGAVKQIHQMRAALTGTTENQSALLGRADIITPPGQAKPNGFVFNYLGIDLYQSTNLTKVNTDADWAGGFVCVGDDSPIVLVIGKLDGVTPWDGRVEYERSAKGRLTQMWVTGRIAVAVVAPERGCRVISAV